MKDNFKLLLKDNVVKVSLIFSLVFIFTMGLLLLFLYKSLPPYAPLLNSLSWGEDRIVPTKILLFLIPLTLSVTASNFLLGGFLYKKNPLLGRIVIFNSFLISLLVFLAVCEVLFLVF